MDVVRLGLGLRALRLRRRMTQAQLASRAGVSSSAIGRMERGSADRVALHTMERISAELGARVDLRLLWQGEALDRLLDSRHAQLVEHMVGLLASMGWEVGSEASFNIRGERGSIDVIALYRPTGSLLVIEVKSVVPDLQALLAGLDRKGRLGPEVARERGWRVATVSRLLVLPNDRTARRRVVTHTATFRSALPDGNVAVRRWLRAPTGTMHGILFVTDGHHTGCRHRVSGRRPPVGPP
jgi:transcriptional regulator with XRE-family HTH domain